MTNAQVKEGLDAIAREVATVPGISLADVSRIQSHVNTISAKLDWTNGMDTSTLPGQVRRVNPVPSRGGKGSGLSGLGGLGGGLLGVLSTFAPFLFGGGSSGESSWLEDVGISGHEQAQDAEQAEHSDALDELCVQTQCCVDSVKEINDDAEIGINEIIQVVLSLISLLKIHPLVRIGALALGPIVDGLFSIEKTVEDRNESIGCCYQRLDELCVESDTPPPAPKEYCPPKAQTPPPCPPAPLPTSPAAPAPAPTPAPAPAPAPAPSVGSVDLPTAPASAIGVGSGALNVNFNTNINTNINICPPQIPQLPTPPQPGPASICLLEQFAAGVECFKQTIEECLPKIECEPPAPAPEPEPAPKPKEEDCLPVQPEPETPPEKLAHMQEPPPPPKGGSVPAAAESAAAAPAEPAADNGAEPKEDHHRTRKTRTW